MGVWLSGDIMSGATEYMAVTKRWQPVSFRKDRFLR